MRKSAVKTGSRRERGMALLLALFALLLLSGVGLFLVVSSNTETRIDANYGSGLRTYYAARSGLEEVRDRIKYASTSTLSPGGLADLLPQDIAGNAGGVLYILNPASGETVDPTDATSPYFDDDLCHQYNSGTPKGVKCTTLPPISNWRLGYQFSLAPTGQLSYKWIRVTMKTNRSVLPSFCVDQDCSTAALDTRICWDGKTEQLSPGGATVPCDASGMQTVYMLTALAVTGGASGPNGGRKLLQVESVAPSIRPAGVLTAASMNVTTSSSTAVMPSLVIDGRAHHLDRTLVDRSLWTPWTNTPPPSNVCSDISALGTDTGAAQMASVLDQMRKNIVNTANNSCTQSGSGMNGNICTPGLWWVRGTDSNTRFVTSTNSGSNSGSDGGSSGGSGSDGDHSGSSTTTCNATTPNCYTYLNLSSPQLFGVSASNSTILPGNPGHVPTVTVAGSGAPFVGGLGNQTDSTIYEPGATQTVADQVAAVQNLVKASVNQQNYFNVSSSMLASSYGSNNPPNPPNPVVVNFTDSTLTLQSGQSLTGFGVLVIPGALEINSGATFNWTGVVLISSASGHVTINPGASGFINGALLLTPGAVFNSPASSPSTGLPSFAIGYSCEAIDMAFSTQPFKIISASETSF
jgi:hypothetical protein